MYEFIRVVKSFFRRNWRCQLGVHCDHVVDEDVVRRVTHQGRSYENVIIYQVECCRCDRVDFDEGIMYGWADARQEGEGRETMLEQSRQTKGYGGSIFVPQKGLK